MTKSNADRADRGRARPLALLVALLLLAGAACGDDDETVAGETTTTAGATTTTAPPESSATTASPSTEATAEPGGDETAPAAELDPDQQAAADAWAVVFDSATTFDEKAPYLVEAESLRGTIEAYAAAGEGFGGISLVPTGAELAEASATITYDVHFGENAAYTDLTGTIDQIDGEWVVSQGEFCGFMASARTPCE